MSTPVIITSPSLDPSKNVSGVSAVTQFIIDNNSERQYKHFTIGREDNGGKGLHRIISNLRLFSRWIFFLKNNPGALIHYNFPLEKPSILRDPLFMKVARLMGHKMVIHIHGGVYMTSPKIPFPFKQILRKVFAWQTPFIVLSQKEKEVLSDRFGVKNVHVLPNCVDLKDPESFHRQPRTRNSPLVLGYLGRITETKGMDYLLKACESLKYEGVSFRLHIAGAEDVKDSYLPRFKKLLRYQFEYAGLVSGKNKQEFLRKIDIFIMPTFFEGLPMSLLECMSYGAVPVVTPVGSIPIVVHNNVNGIFVKVKNVDSVASAIIGLNDDRNLLYNLGQNARETIFKHYSPLAYTEKLNIIYTSIKQS